MLKRFNVKNFLSFSERIEPDTNEKKSQEFSMIPGKVRNLAEHLIKTENQDLLRFAAIYGANASGKSNLVKAMNFMQFVVKRGKIPAKATKQYCKIIETNKTKSSYFEIEMLLNEKVYSYGFEVVLSEMLFVSEWLYEIKTQSEIMLFERSANDIVFGGNLKSIVDLQVHKKDVIADNTLLFLNHINKDKAGFFASNKNAQILQQIYNWFLNILDINYPDMPISTFSYLSDEEKLKNISSLLEAFSTGISETIYTDIDFEKVKEVIPNALTADIEDRIQHISVKWKNKKDSNERKWFAIIRSKNEMFILTINEKYEVMAKKIQFKHTGSLSIFDTSEESDGTMRLFDLLEILLTNKQKVFVIDELDRCLHPCLIQKFIETFFAFAKGKEVQLIVTTHESRLLDFDILRRDEIWFVDKNSEGESTVYSLDEYNERFDKKIDKAYLEGRYGGVPVFSTLFPVKE